MIRTEPIKANPEVNPEDITVQQLEPAFERLCQMALLYKGREDAEGQEQYRKFCDTILSYYKAICWNR